MKNLFKRAVRSLCTKVLPYKPIEVTLDNWEIQYKNENWSHLSHIGELARYTLIVSYCNYFKGLGSVLDIGCGEGILQNRLGSQTYSSYTGIDISSEAITRASKNRDHKTFFICSDAQLYVPDERFDIVIINECLYYFKDPLSFVRRYEGFLKDDGLIIVSMYLADRTKKIWKILERTCHIEDSTTVTNRSGNSWQIACWKTGEGKAIRKLETLI
ncbi:bifunctional 2-polyprenyl-6-hydroxyphenol methylase/3-demethylubiquinol 3-O-methyltransferase UbiG [Methylobacter sp. S3L5C]|uniref:class I SAM-dependent methyltransferase n=1 Tax=Methylobacter sp. S3L5C TaxID=2839024 RepID=UPI001FAC0325|nr:class I SAM-dependent methyltransferase [Methylobacter sp. S3L5C]UOA10191.1 class I SAM-dependent methyltransferase [Methylobacter sp. S3L5C]